MSPRDYLLSLGTDKIEHTGRSFYEHLCNTEDILRIARLPKEVQLAGLFHSIYGTSFFKSNINIDRTIIKDIIGEYAEYLVWIFCNANRPFCWFFNNTIPFIDGNSIEISDEVLFHLRMIESANLIDQQTGANLITAFSHNKER